MLDDIFQLGIITSILATAVRMGTILLLAAFVFMRFFYQARKDIVGLI